MMTCYGSYVFVFFLLLGLFQEGLYRKSPSAAQVRQLKNSFSNATGKVTFLVYYLYFQGRLGECLA